MQIAPHVSKYICCNVLDMSHIYFFFLHFFFHKPAILDFLHAILNCQCQKLPSFLLLLSVQWWSTSLVYSSGLGELAKFLLHANLQYEGQATDLPGQWTTPEIWDCSARSRKAGGGGGGVWCFFLLAKHSGFMEHTIKWK